MVTALGDGIETVWSRMLAGDGGIQPLRRCFSGKYRTETAGEIPPDVESVVCPDPATRCFDLARHVAGRAMERSACNPKGMGLVLSTTKGEITELETIAHNGRASPIGRFNLYRMARDLADALGLDGPTMAVSNACASGLVAVIQAARMVRQKRVRAMLVVGADILSDFVIGGFSSLRALSCGPCRPYDKDRSGLSLGEGAGALVVADAGAFDAPESALIRGWGVSNDANHITGPSRTGEGLKKALRAALQMSGLPPDAIDYVNGHGTGTAYNDEMEAQAFHAVFGDAGVPVSSMKGYFGHTLGAAGVIETALCAMVLRDRTVPASLGLRTPGVGTPIRILDATTFFAPLRTLVTVKSGFGGVNAALVMTRTC